VGYYRQHDRTGFKSLFFTKLILFFLLIFVSLAPHAGTQVIWTEQFPDAESSSVRMLIDKRYLRIDNNTKTGNFTLLDSKKNILYNIVHDDRSVLKIPNYKNPTKLPTFKFLNKKIPAKIPDINQYNVSHRQYFANGTLCFETMSAKNFLPIVTNQLQSYRSLLANQQAKSLFQTPPEYRDLCNTAFRIVSPRQTLQYGLPIVEWTPNGYKRVLTEFKENYAIEDSLFTIPNSYHQWQLFDHE
jgi:hypothetical protein